MLSITFSAFVTLLQYFFTASPEVGNLIIYPHAHGISASDKFKVFVSQGSTKKESFTYITRSDQRAKQVSNARPGRTMSWTSFAFTGQNVTVEVLTNQDFNECIVRPKSYGYHCHRTDVKTAQFTVSSNKKWMSVEFDYDYGSSFLGPDIKDKLMVFVDPPETQTPNKNDNHVLYYDVGIHNLHGQKTLDTHIKEVYLAPGAYVQGGFRTRDGHSVKIHGRGILSTSIYKVNESAPNNRHPFDFAMINMDKGHSHTLEGITMVDPTHFFYRAILSDHNTVRYVKMVGAWIFNNDGIAIGSDSLVEDCFICANDDSIKVYKSDMVVRRVVVWQAQNGAVFQYGWWVARENTRVRISDIDVIHIDWCTFKGSRCHLSRNKAVFNLARDTKTFEMADHVYTNIRVEGSCPRIVYMKMDDDAEGTATNLRIENLFVESQPNYDSYHNEISGSSSGGQFSHIQFVNFRISGQCVRNSNQADFIIDAQTTSNVQFHCNSSIVG